MAKEWNIEIPIGLAKVAKLYLNAVGVKWHCHEYSDTHHLLYYTEPADIDLQWQVQYVLETLAVQKGGNYDCFDAQNGLFKRLRISKMAF